ncbi:MAG: hypothetical protein CM15mP12_6830 [Gammaproteobacteria bacterium]|nr:MAG: hypothetical protein CM15mP12_6830 [Gammaproteobacteria bacterium]
MLIPFFKNSIDVGVASLEQHFLIIIYRHFQVKEKVVFCFDSDEAGLKRMESLQITVSY